MCLVSNTFTFIYPLLTSTQIILNVNCYQGLPLPIQTIDKNGTICSVYYPKIVNQYIIIFKIPKYKRMRSRGVPIANQKPGKFPSLAVTLFFRSSDGE